MLNMFNASRRILQAAFLCGRLKVQRLLNAVWCLRNVKHQTALQGWALFGDFVGKVLNKAKVNLVFSWWGLRLLAVIISVVAVGCIIYMPSQTHVLHYNANNEYFLLTDSNSHNASQAVWLDNYSFSRFKCSIIQGQQTWCGWGVSWPYTTDGMMDFSAFHSLRVKLKYVGQAKKIRIYMRNYHESYSDLAQGMSNKFQSVIVPAHEFDDVVTIPLSEFVVAEWWVSQFNIPRQHAAPDFSAVTTLAIDYPQPGATGEHVMEVQRVELVGELIAKEKAYLSLLIFWLFVLVFEGGYRYYSMNRQVERAHARTLSLASYARDLRTQRSLYKKLSGVDPLTGIYNRAGIKPLLKKSFDDNRRQLNGAVMVIDIDHFKQVNDQYGHNIGDKVIQTVAQIVMGVIRADDLFARWGGEEFLLFCPSVNHNTARIIGEKLRVAVEQYSYDYGKDLTITVSLGVTIVRSDDSFEQAFERADTALYKAKRAGRNRVNFFK